MKTIILSAIAAAVLGFGVVLAGGSDTHRTYAANPTVFGPVSVNGANGLVAAVLVLQDTLDNNQVYILNSSFNNNNILNNVLNNSLNNNNVQVLTLENVLNNLTVNVDIRNFLQNFSIDHNVIGVSILSGGGVIAFT